MAGGMRLPSPDDPEMDPDYEAALRAFVAAQGAPAAPGGVPRPMAQPAAALASMADGAAPPRRIVGPTLTLGPGMSIGTYDVRGQDMTPPPTPEGEALLAELEAAGKASMPGVGERLARGAAEAFTAPGLLQAIQGGPRTERTPLQRVSDVVEDVRNPLPDVEMPLPPEPQPARVETPKPPPTVQVRKAAHVGVPNTAVVQSAARPEGYGAPPTAPAQAQGAEDPVRRALTALALSAGPAQGESDLDAALQAASGRRLVAGLARAGGTMIGRGRGAGYDALDREADRPVEEFQARRNLAADERQQAALRAAAEAARGKQAFAEEMGRGELEVKRGQLKVEQDRLAAQRRTAGGAREADVQKLGKDTEGLARIKADVQLLEQLASSPAGTDIPGAGIWDTKKPAFMQSQGDTDAYQATLRVAAELLHQQSGASVTPQEAERFLESRGMGKGTTEQQFRAGAKALVRDLRAELAAKKAKYPQAAVDVLRKRGGVTELESAAGGAPRKQYSPSRNQTRLIYPDGRVEVRDGRI